MENSEEPGIISRALNSVRKHGFRHAIHWGIFILKLHLTPPSLLYFIRPNTYFEFSGAKYRYLYSKRNFTWESERQVEVPVILAEVRKSRSKRILEVGNVLSNYADVHHDVLDKYEVADGVINEDVVNFKTKRPYDLIVSISTLEHVGWDETPRERMKFVKAIDNLRKNLSKKGKIVFTVPIGYNKDIDWLLFHKKIDFAEVHYLKRISKEMWIETTWENVKRSKCGYPYSNSNAIVVGTITK